MKDNKDYGLFIRFLRFSRKLITPHFKNDINSDFSKLGVYVSHHQNMFGPLNFLTYSDYYVRLWVLNVFSDKTSCFNQYYNYTFTKRFHYPKFLAFIISKVLSNIIPFMMKSLHCIPVYRDGKKTLKTIKDSISALIEGDKVLIFADIDYSNNSSYTGELYKGFLSISAGYHSKTKEHIPFIPTYLSKNKKIIITGKPIKFEEGKSISSQSDTVILHIQNELNRMAKECGDI